MPYTKEKLEKEKKKLKKIYSVNLPLGIIGGFIFSFGYPYIPRKSGRKPQIEIMEYSEAVIENAILFGIILAISFYFLISKSKSKIERLVFNVNVFIIDPVGYFDMISLIKNSKMILTDSGGLQKESYFFNKFCVTLRNETEWKELVDYGYNKIVGANKDAILQSVNYFETKRFNKEHQLYGGGKASEKVYATLNKLHHN